ncbi:3-oxoacyl-ACP synthase III family protein [Nocardia sp. NPDC051750]|uniref:3-oxoacyl-ACP synthase III family protein n=1 Tax=Nocardia sp. NPDC051750 TaxID=3364325 RepID=UPI0037A41246
MTTLPDTRLSMHTPLAVPVAIAGTGLHLPPAVISNQQLTETLDTSDEWIVEHTGIRERRHLSPELAVSDMAVAAAEDAIAASGVRAVDLDAVLIATYTGDQILPSTALMVADRLGARRALPIDITQAACANGLQAMLLAAHLLQSTARTVLVVAADCASRVTDPADRTTRVFFGDAAVAIVLTRGTEPGTGLLSWDFGAELSDSVQIPAGGSRLPASARTVAEGAHYLHMDGRAVWEMATEQLPRSIENAVRRAGSTVNSVDHFFLHQANLRIVTAAMDRIAVSMDRAPVTVDRLGNTGSAGAFTALHTLMSQGRIHSGDTFVLSAIGAGFQWGTLYMRHP